MKDRAARLRPSQSNTNRSAAVDAASEPAIVVESTSTGPTTIKDAAGRQRYDHIDALRAYSVFIVVLGHASILGLLGDSGVVIFFTISGFIITWLLLRERDRTGNFHPLGFWRRRLLKLGPPLLIVILIPTAVYAIWKPVAVVAVLSQALFCFNWVYLYVPSGHHILPGTEPVWSLAVEEQFYIVFAVFWIATIHAKRQLSQVACLAFIAIVAANIIRFIMVHDGGISILAIERGTDTRMDALAIGVLAALLYHMFTKGRIPWLRKLGSSWTLLFAVVVYLLTEVSRDVTWRNTLLYTIQPFTAAAVILYGLLSDDGLISRLFHAVCRSRIVATIGLASYSIYLLNDVAIHALEGPLRSLGHIPSELVEIIVSVLGGILVYYAIEAPVLRLKVRRGW